VQDVKDMNREQELDLCEDHDTWLELVKQDWDSFQRLKEAQTDQQRKVCIIKYKPGYPKDNNAAAHSVDSTYFTP